MQQYIVITTLRAERPGDPEREYITEFAFHGDANAYMNMRAEDRGIKSVELFQLKKLREHVEEN